MYGSFAFLVPVFVALSTFGGVNGTLLTSSRYVYFNQFIVIEALCLNKPEYNVTNKLVSVFRLFYAGAVEGQMPEILSMIQVNKMTPAPAVLVVVSIMN